MIFGVVFLLLLHVFTCKQESGLLELILGCLCCFVLLYDPVQGWMQDRAVLYQTNIGRACLALSLLVYLPIYFVIVCFSGMYFERGENSFPSF